MPSFFKKRAKGEDPKLQGEESSVSSEDLGHLKEESTGEEEVETELSFAPTWNVSKEDMYSFQFLNRECAPLKPNQVSLSGIELRKDDLQKNVLVTAFLRNSLDKAIKFEKTTLVLIDEEGKVLGRKQFDLSEVGELPARSSRPWIFEFTPKDMLKVDLPQTGWKLAFQLESKHQLDLEPTWEKSLDANGKKQLQALVEKVGAPKKGEVNFMGVQAQLKDDGSLHVTMLIRNGSEKNINLEQLPLHVEDATGELVAKGGFKLEKFTVKANTSKPWSFIFPKEMIIKEQPDLSKWKAYAPQK